MRYLPIQSIVTALALILAFGCSPSTQESDSETSSVDTATSEPAAEPAPAAEPEMMATDFAEANFIFLDSMSESTGRVRFSQLADSEVLVQVELTGVEPGLHGFHLHAKGDCSSSDFKSSGGHFNPESVDHAGPADLVHHAGDFGNIEVGEDGNGSLELVAFGLSVQPAEHSVQGRAVILHAGEDDLTTQPTGAAGARLGCALIEARSADEAWVIEGSDAAQAAADAMRSARAAAAPAAGDSE